jgi:galactofuranosylgalactofuranosylrhamnosyl-N-acetylglucosaminyl-diphospho-decaprenol beta-1,5/1,6-galactofuranosyltransferase
LVLQRLILPGDMPQADARMFWRAPGGRLRRGETIRLDTYFNAFSLDKWIGYTCASAIYLRLAFRGQIRVTIYRATLRAGAVHETQLSQADASGDAVEIELSQLGGAGMLYPVIEARSDDAELFGGHYGCRDAPVRAVHVAMGICTYRREAYVASTLAALRAGILENADDPMHGRFSVFIADNGRTLDAREFSCAGVHLFPNANAGGAGGFARCMLEAMRADEPITHVMISDDDIELHPEALRRIDAFLQMVKPEYAARTLAGAMLRMDKRHVQTELAGLWRGQFTESLHRDFDMREFSDVLRNDRPLSSDYNAWWCSVIPMEVIRKKGLPLPLFIRFDDVEYGLRTGGNSISLSGICVWHEPFDGKRDVSMEYYHARNGQIVNALHRPEMGGFKRFMKLARHTYICMIRYRYDEADCALFGISDYLNGPEWLMRLDYEKQHAAIRRAGAQPMPTAALSPPITRQQAERGQRTYPAWRKALCMLTLNGIFVKKRESAVVIAHEHDMCAVWGRTTIVHLLAGGELCYVTERDNRAALRLTGRFLAVALRYAAKSGAVARKYRAARATMTGAAFWAQYLKLHTGRENA